MSEKQVLLKPISRDESIAARFERQLALADRLDCEARSLDRLIEARQAVNPKREEMVRETSRFVFSWLAGAAVGALAGLVLGVLESVGLALGGAIARYPLIAFPPIVTFILALAVQTMGYTGSLSWSIIGQFVSRATWVASIVALAAGVMYGMWRVRRELRGGDYIERTEEKER